MMLPIATDAPVYHRPIATIGLITVNSAIFLLLGQPQELMLSIGSGWHPTQWVTAAFLHAHVLHLVGNMVFLWAYGLVVEGKIGWWRFLAAYLLMGALQNLLAQTVVGAVNGELRYVLGASGAISSLMAMALLWAPVNEFTVVWGYSFGFSAFARDDELSIWAFSLWFIGWDLLSASLLGFALCTPMLHLTGVAFGLIAGVLFLQLRWVDCENCDVLSLWLGREGTPSKQLKIAGKSAWTMFRKNRAPQKRRRAQPKIVYSQQGIAASEQRRPQELRRPQ